MARNPRYPMTAGTLVDRKAIVSLFVAIALTGAFAILSSTMSKTPILPLFAKSLGASEVEIGWIAVASTIPGILISMPSGALGDRLGRRKILMASLVVFATAPFLYLMVTGAWGLGAVRFYHGIATAVFGTVALAVIAEQFPEERAMRLSSYSSATIAGRSIAPFLGGLLISVSGYNAVFVVCGIAGVAAFAIGTRIAPDRREPTAKSADGGTWRDLLAVVRNRAIIATSLTEATQYFAFGAVEAFLALLADALGMPAWRVGIVLGAQLVGIVVVKPAMGAVSDRRGRKAVIIPGLAIGALAAGLMPQAASFLELLALSVIFGLGFAAVTSSTSALVADLSAGRGYGTSMGVLRTILDIGQSGGPVVTGWVIVHFGYTDAFLVIAAVQCLGIAILTLGVRGRI